MKTRDECVCGKCGHRWDAYAEYDNCPKCGSDDFHEDDSCSDED